MQTCFALHKYFQVSQNPQAQLSQTCCEHALPYATMPYSNIGHDLGHCNSMQICLHPLWCRYVGLWQTSVLSLDLAAPAGGLGQQVSTPVINFLFGDASSARTQVDVPYNQRSAFPVFCARPKQACLCAPWWVLCMIHLLWHVRGQLTIPQGQCPGRKLFFFADMRMYMWESLLSCCYFPTRQTFLLSR